MGKSPVQTVKQFTREVQKRVDKIFPKLVDNEARKILDAGHQPSEAELQVVHNGWTSEPSLVPATATSTAMPCKQALEVYGSKVKAARALGIAETTFRDRLKKELATL